MNSIDILKEKLKFISSFEDILVDTVGSSNFVKNQLEYIKSLKEEFFPDSKKYILNFINEKDLQILCSYDEELYVRIYEHKGYYTVAFCYYPNNNFSSKIFKNSDSDEKDCDETLLENILNIYKDKFIECKEKIVETPKKNKKRKISKN